MKVNLENSLLGLVIALVINSIEIGFFVYYFHTYSVQLKAINSNTTQLIKLKQEN